MIRNRFVAGALGAVLIGGALSGTRSQTDNSTDLFSCRHHVHI